MKLLVIGLGNMGGTYSKSILRSNFIKQENVAILEKSPEKRAALQEEGYDVYEEADVCLPKADLIIIAVKPQHANSLFDAIKPYTNPEQIYISIMAGVKIKTIQEGLNVPKVIRAMPNLPAQVGKGMTSFTASDEVSRIELMTVQNLLNTTGKSIFVATEKFIDASTGISGSGPAYVFYFMQSMMEAARKMGFSDTEAKLLVSQTFAGAVELFNQSKATPLSWMNRVASKGGTTRAALDSLEDNNVDELIKEAAFAAFNRAIELGK